MKAYVEVRHAQSAAPSAAAAAMLEQAMPMLLRTWTEARQDNPGPELDLVAIVSVGPHARGGHVEVLMVHRTDALEALAREPGPPDSDAERRLSRSALLAMTSDERTSLGAMAPGRTADAIWVVLEDGKGIAGVLCLGWPRAIQHGGDA